MGPARLLEVGFAKEDAQGVTSTLLRRREHVAREAPLLNERGGSKVRICEEFAEVRIRKLLARAARPVIHERQKQVDHCALPKALRYVVIHDARGNWVLCTPGNLRLDHLVERSDD